MEENDAFENDNRALLDGFGNDLTTASQSGGVLDYSSSGDSNSDPDNKVNPDEKPTFILPLMFQLKPNKEGAIIQENNNSLGTNAPGVTNATKNIAAEIEKSKYVKIEDDGIAINNLTDATM